MSFLSVEPQSKVVLENYSNTLLAQFDSHLGIIKDRYLAFFRERSLNPVRVLYVTLTIQSSGEPSRQHSQLFPNKPICLASFLFFKVSSLYENSMTRQKPSMRHSTLTLNHLLQEQHGMQ